MALEDTLTLTSAGSGGTRTFTSVEQVGKRNKRHDMGTTLAEPRDLVVDHQNIPGNKTRPVSVRNLTGVTHTIIDGNGVPQQQTVNITVTETLSTVWTDAITEDNLGFAIALWEDDATRAAMRVGKS